MADLSISKSLKRKRDTERKSGDLFSDDDMALGEEACTILNLGKRNE